MPHTRLRMIRMEARVFVTKATRNRFSAFSNSAAGFTPLPAATLEITKYRCFKR
jgi:hypothetical protein